MSIERKVPTKEVDKLQELRAADVAMQRTIEDLVLRRAGVVKKQMEVFNGLLSKYCLDASKPWTLKEVGDDHFIVEDENHDLGHGRK